MGNAVTVSGKPIATGSRGSTGSPAVVFPDVCLTPPETYAGPTPIPYPNLAMSEGSRTGIASKSVKIKGKDAVSASKSAFKKSAGDEAGNSSMKGGVITKKALGRTAPQGNKITFRHSNQTLRVVRGSRARAGGPAAVRSPAARKGVAVGTGATTQEPAAGVNAPPPIPCGNPKCMHHTARIPATQTAQLPADKALAHGLLSPIVCLECYRKFVGLEPYPAAAGG